MLRPLSPVLLCLLAGLGSAIPSSSGLASAAADDFQIDTAQREAVRQFYQSVFWASEQVDAGWDGNLVRCDPGSLSPDYQAATIRRVNWFRAMAGVPADVNLDDIFSADAQQAALILSANRSLIALQNPASRCYSPAGEQAAQHSNLTIGAAGPAAVVSQFMELGDKGAGVGHRSDILYPQTQSMGAGAIPATGARLPSGVLWVEDTLNALEQRPVRDGFVAWPPAGFVPYSTVFPRWSFSYPGASFSRAEIRMWRSGVEVPVEREISLDDDGFNTLVWIPAFDRQGDRQPRPAEDETYRIEIASVLVNGKLRDFHYQVILFDPMDKGADYAPQDISGPDIVPVGEEAEFDFTPVTGADRYRWRYARISPDAGVSSAESALGQEGIAVDEDLTLVANLMTTSNGELWFSSEFSGANEYQVATVEVSEDGGHSWVAIWEQVPDARANSYLEPVIIPLSQYEQRAIQLRFAFADTNARLNTQAQTSALWRVNDIEVREAPALDLGQSRLTENSDRFSLVADQPGPFWVQVQPQLFGGYPGEWSPLKPVEVAGTASAYSQRKTALGQVRVGTPVSAEATSPLPDLVVLELKNPADTDIGLGKDIVAISVDIQNTGDAESGPFVTGFYLSNNENFEPNNRIGECSASGLRVGQVGRCTGSIDTTELQIGNSEGKFFRAYVNDNPLDDANPVLEKDSSNNIADVEIKGSVVVPDGGHSPNSQPSSKPPPLVPTVR